MLNRVRLWIRSVVLRRRIEREMQEEMAQHLERATERLMARGLSAEEAAREARREFGNVTYLQEEGRLARGTGALDALAGDARFALRQFARRPGTTLIMLGVLAVGLCLSTLMFSFVQGFAVQPPEGVARADDLVHCRHMAPSPPRRLRRPRCRPARSVVPTSTRMKRWPGSFRPPLSLRATSGRPAPALWFQPLHHRTRRHLRRR